jgi:hypothetical protein
VTRPVQLQYTVSFEAKDISLNSGDCTDLVWSVQGASNVQLDGDSVEPSGRKKVCPEEDKSYKLTFQVSGSTEIESREVKISVQSN